MGTPLREGPVRPLPAMAAGGCDGGSNWSRAPGKCRQSRWVGSTSGGICPSLRSGYPGAALYSLSEPTAWPPALRAESEIPPPAFGRPPPFLKGGFWHPTQGGKRQPRVRREQRAGWGGVAPAGSQFPSPFGLRKLKSPPEGRGAHGGTGPPVRADLPRRGGPSAEGPRPLHPPLEGCRPARGPGGLPGRSLSLSLGRESEARTSGATGVILE